MKYVIDIPQGLKIDFENENWTALSCMEMKDALTNSKLLDNVLDEIQVEIVEHAFNDVNGSKYIFVNRVDQIIDKYRKEQE